MEPRIVVKIKDVLTADDWMHWSDQMLDLQKAWKLTCPILLADETTEIININKPRRYGLLTRLMIFFFIMYSIMKGSDDRG